MLHPHGDTGGNELPDVSSLQQAVLTLTPESHQIPLFYLPYEIMTGNTYDKQKMNTIIFIKLKLIYRRGKRLYFLILYTGQACLVVPFSRH